MIHYFGGIFMEKRYDLVFSLWFKEQTPIGNFFDLLFLDNLKAKSG
ncbi:Hypothetical protein Ccan_19920 [Capnocytophaga canimorsus Cc5]|uniref:Uncharacterized protein n=1 Tax=Capnocytophaga canimorsus (strain 5) TaxID=860228 RepID=F9YTR3_CAPCC|nr:Hypothetical protein Ccan_19920 [Capnocytophaga canimorsus Cc5]